MFAPAIPGLNDHELEAVLERAAAAGAMSAGYVALRLPLGDCGPVRRMAGGQAAWTGLNA